MELTQLSQKSPQITQRLTEVLAELPLASARNLAAVMGREPAVLYPPLRNLQEAGLVDSAILGCTRERTARWCFTDKGRAQMGMEPISWHDEAHRCRLLERFPSLEWFYQVLGSVEEMGRFQAFQWVEGLGFDAAAKFENGWIALFWSGYLQTEETIGYRLDRFSQDINELNKIGEMPYPSMFCYVVSDRWQATLVDRVTKIHRMDDMVSIWCVSDGTRTGTRDPRPNRGWVHQPVALRNLGGWAWSKRVEASPWSKERGVTVSRVLDVVAQWPGVTTSQCRQMLGEGPTGRGADVGLKTLREHGFVGRVQNGRATRYYLEGPGIHCLVRRDRTKTTSYKRRVLANSLFQKPRLQTHEEGVMSIIAQFAAAGVPVAPGWRSWEHLRDAAIAPDALVYLTETPLVPSWHYVEYERSARSLSRVEKKLAGYGSRRRQNDWPLMVVCWNSEVESRFHDVALDYDISMFTTNVKRMTEYGPMNNGQCWVMFDAPVVIGRLPEDEDGSVSGAGDLVDGTVDAFSEDPALIPGTAS